MIIAKMFFAIIAEFHLTGGARSAIPSKPWTAFYYGIVAAAHRTHSLYYGNILLRDYQKGKQEKERLQREKGLSGGCQVF